MSVSLLTDQYELTMLQAAIADGTADRKATFEVFARSLPEGFRYGVFGGLGRLLPMIEEFTFNTDELTWLEQAGIVDLDTRNWLANYRFTGTVTAYREGDLYFPQSPVLTVEGTFGECVILETLILSVLNADSSIMTKAARMVSEANGRNIIEMGSRRTHERAAVDVARAAYIAGFSATSNLQAGMTYGIPTTGTAAHAWTLAHDSEEDAFAAQINGLGFQTTLLVDTYNIREGVERAMDAVRLASNGRIAGPGAIRIDSGDLYTEAFKAREQLDSRGAEQTKIVVSGDMDEYTMKDLKDAPIDGYGVGTKLVSTKPSGFVYKLVEIERVKGDGSTYMSRVSKNSKNKVSVGGKKRAWRQYDDRGTIKREFYRTDANHTAPGSPYQSAEEKGAVRTLTDVVMEKGRTIVNIEGITALMEARAFHADEKHCLPSGEQRVWVGEFSPFLTAEQAHA